MGRFEDRDGVATLALYLDGFRPIAAAVVAGPRKSLLEIMFCNPSRGCGTRGLFLGDKAAVGTGESLSCGIPFQLSAAIGAGTLTKGGDGAHSARNASRAAFVMRYWDPIFLA